MHKTELRVLRLKFQVAIQAHERAVQEFLVLRNDSSSHKMIKTYEDADNLRQQIKELKTSEGYDFIP